MKQERLKESNRLDDLEIEEMSNDWETMSQQSTTTKQTAVDWLVEKIQHANPTFKFDALIREAKAMEKEQMGDTWVDSRIEDNGDEYIGKQKSFEEYFNETFKSE